MTFEDSPLPSETLALAAKLQDEDAADIVRPSVAVEDVEWALPADVHWHPYDDPGDCTVTTSVCGGKQPGEVSAS